MNTYKFIFTREDGTQGTDHLASSIRLALADPAKRAEYEDWKRGRELLKYKRSYSI